MSPVVLAWAKDTGADLAKTNVNGGAIAIGHPATETRLHEPNHGGDGSAARVRCERFSRWVSIEVAHYACPSLLVLRHFSRASRRGDALEQERIPMPPTKYQVKSGDTLTGLAGRFYGDGSLFPVISVINHLADPDQIDAGQQLLIPYVTFRHQVRIEDGKEALAQQF